MRAISIQDAKLLFCDELPPPTPAADEVIVNVTQAGICETDLQLARGYMGFSGILGHEFVGVAQSGRFAGRRVVGEINCSCRNCPRCDAAMGNHCEHRTVIGIDRHDGAFAESVAIPEHNLHLIPDSVSDDEAVFVEPLAAAFQIGQQIPLASTDRVVILGDGRLAYLCSQAIGLACDEILVVGKHARKLNHFAACSTILLDDLSTEKSFDVVVDCTGSPTGLPLALQLVRPRGTIVMKTTVALEHHLSLAPIVIDEIRLIGSRCGPFEKAIEALRDHKVEVTNLITHRFPLESATEAMKTATSPAAFKVVFDI